MYPGNYSIEWLGYKGGEPVEETPKVGCVAKAWQWRERGINPPNQPPNKTVLENIAEDILVQKPLQITSCDLPGYPRSTFLMVFSPDGTKLASTHGNHNIYVSELASGKHVRILRGHPRTPWCIAFHPSHPQLIGSGCLGGQVRVWDIASGGSEVWNVFNETVIASIAFHPREQLLVIATYNELYFWDWSQPAPFTKVSTNNINEKVRYVAFDSLGFKLITGISLWACASNAGTPLISLGGSPNSANNSNNGGPGNSSGSGNGGTGNNGGPGNNGGGNNGGPGNGGSPGSSGGPGNSLRYGINGSPNNAGPGIIRSSGNNGGPGNSGGTGNNSGSGIPRTEARARSPDSPGAAQDMIVNSYQTLVQRYDSLVRNYQRLFMIDRGTDPMETYPPEAGRPRRRSSRRSLRSASASSSTTNNPGSPTAGPSRQDAVPTVATFMSPGDPFRHGTRADDTSTVGVTNLPVFRSIPSAFQPLGDERTTRLLPNPFSSTNGSPGQPNSSRTSGMFRNGPESALSALRQFSIRRRNLDAAENATRTMTAAREALNATRVTCNLAMGNTNVPTGPASTPSTPQARQPDDPLYVPPPLPSDPPPSRPPPPPEPTSETLASGMAPTEAAPNSSTAQGNDPIDPDGEANTINESLDLIRDILRDSGTRLLNLITNMSMNILSNSERDESARVPVHVFTGNLRRDLLASSSDSDSEHTEVNITRTPNTTFREGTPDAMQTSRPATNATAASRRLNASTVPQISNRMTFELETPSEGPSREGGINISDRMTFELNETTNESPSREGGINVSLANERFRVRTQTNSSVTPDAPPPATAATPRASTSSAARDEPQAGPSTAPDSTTFDPSVPSTSTDEDWTRSAVGGPVMPAAEAIRRVQLGVTALQKHTLQLANMWLRGDRTSLRALRGMWEDLRRRIMMLYREAGGRADAPSFYTRSLLERCMILTELTEITNLPSRPSGRPRRSARTAEGTQSTSRSGPTSQSTARTEEASSSNTNNPSTSAAAAQSNSSNDNTNDNRTSRAARANRVQRTRRLVRLQQAYRWRADDEARRRERNAPVYRISNLRARSHRSNLMRTVEQNATRHVIRTRAMKVLSVMFNMMMMCLEERGLSQLIINMLKTLKKALALTCFMMMSNRNMPREEGAATPAAQSVASDVVRIQSAEHSGPVNVEDTADPQSLRVVRYNELAGERPAEPAATTSTQTTPLEEPPPSLPPMPDSTSQSWSHRLAVQIAAANRNTSSTANTRRDLYLETRRQKALHRTNPTAHPFIRRRFPPVLSHRIPSLRSLPPGRFHRVSPRSPPPGPDSGPSTSSDNPNDPALPPHDCENFIRLAHIRLRTAARNRFRRLQTIRLYTPSSVREMFALQDFQQENRNDGAGGAAPEESNEPSFGSIAAAQQNRSRVQYQALMAASESMLPLMQVNDLPPAAEAQAGQAHRLPRIQEYLQPIILAQNAMMVEDSDGNHHGPGIAAGVHGNRRLGGMAGLLDAGIISEALPAPSHRVQAWDFTSGAAPDIADNTKNVVVQRCRIHNDASIDISKDGRLLVALLPVPRLRNTNNWLGVYSLEWPRLGQCLHTAVLEQSAVSVALSPTARYLAVGLGSRRFTSSHSRTNIIALLYKLDPLESSSRTGLSPMKELEQYWEHGFTSLNCLRWAPQPGQGLVYANNTGQLIIMS